MASDASLPVQTDFWCADVSRSAGEEVGGTAPRADTWLLLEVPGSWNPKAFEESDLPADVKEHLEAALDRLPSARIQFIKRPLSRESESIALFVALAGLAEPALYRFALDSYTDLTRLPLTLDWLSAQTPLGEALYLVCTHTSRDRCCAKYGMQTFNQMAALRPGQVWQSSHLGGHRFAANVACLPEGIVYGRVMAEGAGALIETHEAGDLQPALLRGRSILSQAAQVAEVYLHHETGDTQIGAYRLVREEPIVDDGYLVAFADQSGTQHTVQMRTKNPPYVNYLSCGVAATKAVDRYELVAVVSDTRR